MSLTQQFLVTLALPAAFLSLAIFYWRAGGLRQQGPYWLLTLLSTSLWAGTILSHYGGSGLPAELAFTWRVTGHHALTFLALLVLLSTTAYLSTPREITRLALGVGFFLWLASLLLDPAVWPYRLPPINISGFDTDHFSLWSAVWVTSWFIPLLAAGLLTRRAVLEAPSAVEANRLNYWQLSLLLVTLSGSVALIQQSGQPAWQEVGALGLAFSMGLGTAALTRANLPNLKLSARHVAARLSATLLIFVVTWWTLWFLARQVPERGDFGTTLDLAVAAAAFTALFVLLNRAVPRLMRRLFLPSARAGADSLAEQIGDVTDLLDAETLGRALLEWVRGNLATERGRLFVAEDGPSGAIVLRPLAQMGFEEQAAVAQIGGNSPLATYLRSCPATPLSTFEIETVAAFSDLPAGEKEVLQQWQCELFIPLCAGQQLVGVLALAEKYSGESYDEGDLAWIQERVVNSGPMLWQAQSVGNARRLGDYALEEMRRLGQEKQHLEELLTLHERFAQMVSPALRQPFASIYSALQQLQVDVEENGNRPVVDALNGHLARLRVMINDLILTADRVQQQRTFSFAPVQMREVIEHAVRNLSTMAEGRRVEVQVGVEPQMAAIQGDEQRLQEAVQHLLHNAIKFNKIGGSVEVNCGVLGGELYLHVRDDGVGIPESQLEQVWTGRAKLEGEGSKQRGPGLGLALTRFIARAHGGRVEVSSKYGSGSTFSLYLPVVDDHSRDVREPASEEIDSAATA